MSSLSSLPRAPSSKSRKQRLGWTSSSSFDNDDGTPTTTTGNGSPLLLRRGSSSSFSPTNSRHSKTNKAVGIRQTRLFLRLFVLPTLAVSVVYLQLHSLGVVLHPDDTIATAATAAEVDMAAPQTTRLQVMTTTAGGSASTANTTATSTSTNPFDHGTTPLHKWEETRLREVFQPTEERRLQSRPAAPTTSPLRPTNNGIDLDQTRDSVVQQIQQRYEARQKKKFQLASAHNNNDSLSLHKFQPPSHGKPPKEEEVALGPYAAAYKKRLKERFRTALSHGQQAGNTTATSTTSKSTEEPAPVRQRPSEKVLYFVHIHKSGGTILCSLAHHNALSVNRQYNCNVQPNQRCCGESDSQEGQTHYAQETPYDLVAAETQMYSGMDATHYNYIVVLRQSQQRYFSHWKHILRDVPAKRVRRKPTPKLMHPSSSLQKKEKGTASQLFSSRAAGAAARAAARKALVQNHKDLPQQQRYHPHDSKKHAKTATPRQRPPRVHPARTQQQRFLLEKEDDKDMMEKEEATKSGEEEDDDDDDANEDGNEDGGGGKKEGTHKVTTSNRASSWKTRAKDPPLPGSSNLNNNTNNTTTTNGTSTTTTKPKKPKTKAEKPHPKKLEHPAQALALLKKSRPKPVIGTNFSEWWKKQPDNWNSRQICGTKCMGVPKYQLTKEHWNYILERFLQFHTILFLEDLQGSVEVLAERLHWKQTNMTAVQLADQWEREGKKAADDAKKRTAYRRTSKPQAVPAYATEPPLQAPNTSVAFADWDPLMSALDDALYDIARRWERLKQEQKWPLPTLQLQQQASTMAPKTATLMQNLTDHQNLPQALRQHFELYFQDEPNNHRHQCEHECCSYICSKW